MQYAWNFGLQKIKVTQFLNGFRPKKGNNSKLLNMLIVIVILRNNRWESMQWHIFYMDNEVRTAGNSVSKSSFRVLRIIEAWLWTILTKKNWGCSIKTWTLLRMFRYSKWLFTVKMRQTPGHTKTSLRTADDRKYVCCSQAN